MPRMKPEDVELFLSQPHVGVLATLRRDGMPYTVPVWWLWKDGAVWLTGTYSRVWCKQLLRDGRASLCIESGPPFTGHVEFDGTCTAYEPTDFDIWPISRELAEKYVGRGDPANAAAVDAFFANMQTEPRLLFKLTPSVTRAIDMRVYRGKRADREYQAAQEESP
ncbi:MAG: pyridoxamine 5'-phosphate oxidase family protein [Dehalococcoidia bacterium]|nr:pyridoxamine 5'-phosphate oxidase family protein [Dehalococcoidia bacterium]